jgi:multiple sugar transport system substrate-binding protein
MGTRQEKTHSRRRLLKLGALGGLGVAGVAVLAGCGETQVVTETKIQEVVKEVPVEKIVTQIVEREKAVEVEVEKIVEKVVTQIVEKQVVVVQEKVVTVIVEAEAMTPKRPTGEVLYWNYMTNMQNIERQILRQFELANPDVKLKAEWIPWQQYWQKLNASLNAGEGAPDVWNTAPTFYYQYVDLGQLLELDDLIKRDLNVNDYWQRTLGQWRAPQGRGPFFGVPRNYVLSVIYYNKSLMDAAGAAYPDDTWSTDDLLETAQKVNNPTGDPRTAVFGFDIPGKGNRTFLDPLIYANGGRVLNEDLTECVINSESAIATIKWMQDLYQVHEVTPAPGFFEGLGNSFQTGRVAMTVTGSWSVGSYRPIRAFGWDIALFPKGSQSRVTYGGPDGFVISKQTKNPEGAWATLRHMIDDDSVISFYLENPGMVPIKKELANDARYISINPPDLRVLLRSEPYMAADFNANYNEWQGVKVNLLDEVWLGQKTPEDAAPEVENAINEILQRSN